MDYFVTLLITISFQLIYAVSAKDCSYYNKFLPWPKLHKFRNESETRKYGEDFGNGSMDVLLLGNSFMRFNFPWFHKALDRRYRRMTVFVASTCNPFINHTAVKDFDGLNATYCDWILKRSLKYAKKMEPDFIYFSVGYRAGFVNRTFEGESDVFVRDAVKRLQQYSTYTKRIVIDLPWMFISPELGAKLYAAERMGLDVPTSESGYAYEDFLRQQRNSINRLKLIEKHCPKCKFVNIQQHFCNKWDRCESYHHRCRFSYYMPDGLHMSYHTRNKLYDVYKAVLDKLLEHSTNKRRPY